jgi:PAP2 superfamily
MIRTLSSASLRSSRTASAWGSRKQGTTRPGHGSDPARTTPAFSRISPDLCDDGHDAPCVTGPPGGLAQAGCFLSQRVPKIMAAPAYQDCGLIVITFDGGSDSAVCCGEASEFGPDDPTCRCPAFSTGVGLEMPGLAAPVGVRAAAVGMSRVVNGVHYPSDIAGGWAVGVGVGMLTLRCWPRRQSQPAAASAA